LIVALAAFAGAARAQAAEPEAGLPLSPAVAPADDPTTIAAREAIVEGQAFARQERWSEALAALERSASLRPHPLTTFNIGFCERALGRATRARKAFTRALQERDASGAVLSGVRREQAEKYLQELERRVVKVDLVIGSPLDALTVDGRPLEEERRDGRTIYVAGTSEPNARPFSPVGSVVLLADLGNHVIVGVRAGRPDIVSNIGFEPDRPAIVELRAPAEVHPMTASTSAITATAEPPAAAVPASRIWAYSALGVGAAGLISGAVFGAIALSRRADLDSNPDCHEVADHVECDPALSSEIDNMHFWGDAATVAFVVGGVGAATGAGLLIFGAGKSPQRGQSTVQPWLGLGSAGVRGSF
jgi:hypothetical protein